MRKPKGPATNSAPGSDGQALSHLDAAGRANMVDVSAKDATVRIAVARGRLEMGRETADRLRQGRVQKGDVWAVARVAGIMAAKQTHLLVPLCHPLPLDHLEVRFALVPGATRDSVIVEASARTRAPTGVEMEALTAVQIATLTLYDMLKAVDRTMVIADVHVAEKSGGRSGDHHFEHPCTEHDLAALTWL